MIKAIILPLATSLLFAGSFIAGKYTTADLQPLTTALLRYGVAILFLSGLAARYGYSTLKVARSDGWKLALLGLFGSVGYHYFFFLSLRYTEVANTAIINASNPAITALMAALILNERLLFRNYLGGAIALLGVLTILTRGRLFDLLQMQVNIGDVFMVCAVLCWVVYALLLKQLSKRYSGFTLTYYASLTGVLLLAGLAIAEHPIAQIQSLSIPSILAILYMGIGASGIGYLLYNLSIVKIGPTKTSSSVYSLVPVCVAILAFLFFREPITPIMIISASLIILGVNLMLFEKPKPLQ